GDEAGRDPVPLRDGRVWTGTSTLRPPTGGRIEAEEAELRVVAARPLEVVGEGPVEVAPHVGEAIGDHALEDRQVIDDVLGTLLVGGVGDPVLGDVDGPPEGTDEGQEIAQALGAALPAEVPDRA